MDLRSMLLPRLARQLGRPSGVAGLVVARRLNRSNVGMVTAAIDAADPQPGETVGDIGFGGGLGLRLLLDRVGPDGHVTGVDLSATMHRAARQRFRRERKAGQVSVHQGSVLDLPLQDALLDAAISVHVLYFVDDLAAAFGELHRVLKPGGRLAVAIGDPVSMKTVPVVRHGFRVRPIAEVTSAMAAAGLRETDHRRVGAGDLAAHVLVWARPATT